MTVSELEPTRRPQAFEPCEECGAPMDPQQRYCVNCAARRGNGANPASRYFATMSKRARRPPARPAAKAKKEGKGNKAKGKSEGKVVAHTSNGDVHEVTNFKASQDKVEEDTKAVEENPEQTGENYIKAQQNLPDVIVVGGEGGGTAPAPSGVEP